MAASRSFRRRSAASLAFSSLPSVEVEEKWDDGGKNALGLGALKEWELVLELEFGGYFEVAKVRKVKSAA